jgi:hypothetical protein
MTRAFAADDGVAFRSGLSDLMALITIRANLFVTAEAPQEVLEQLKALLGALMELDRPAERRHVPAVFLPVEIYLGDSTGHERVEAAVEALARSAGLTIPERDDPVFGSWFRRMRAKLAYAARSPAAQNVLDDMALRAELELLGRAEADVTALLMANLAPLITSLHDTRDAVVRLGAVLVVKSDWVLYVNQLTARQQLVLNHNPHLLRAPDKIMQALGLPLENDKSPARG